MAKFRLPYGRSQVTIEVDDQVHVDVIEHPARASLADQVSGVRAALADPYGGFDWRGGHGSVAIAVNDKTRPVPHDVLLPPLLDQLHDHGVPDEAITFCIAVGGHPPMEPAEFESVLPSDIVQRYRVLSHDADADDLVELGATSRGTPIRVNRDFVAADMKIVVGTIEPHQFVGFSGGVKSAAIGLAGRATIDHNHSLMRDPEARIGTYAINPARQDIEEIGRAIGVDLALNVVLNPHREIVKVLAGEPVAVMEAGVPLARLLSQVAVHEPYDVVVASPGGHPKDLNVYQAQKAIASAAQITRPGGTIVLVAACSEGSGSSHYEGWVAEHTSHGEVLDAFEREGFRLGPHKAFQIARDAAHHRLLVHSELPADTARRLLLDRVDDLQSAVDEVISGEGPDVRVAVLPHASTTIPYLAASTH